MLSPRSLFAVLLIVPGATISSKAADTAVTFASVVKSHYAEWTKGSHDKKLTAERIGALVNNPKVRGDEAMAIAAVHNYLRGKNAPKEVDEKFLLEPKKTDAKAKLAGFQDHFAGYRTHLKTVPHTLFAKDAPKRDGIRQGSVGDCYLVSTIGALVTYHPDRVKSMIQEEKGGAYTVKFPGNKPIKVPPLTDAQIVLGNSAGPQGLWLNVMAEAYAIDRKSKGHPEVVEDDLGGGSCIPIIELMTGEKANQIKHISPSELAAKGKEGAEKEVEKLLLPVHEHKILACTSTSGKTSSKSSLPPGIAGHHAYGVIGFDPGKKEVTLWNPWGGDFKPKGSPGLTHGYPRKEGAFTMPLCEYVVVYHALEEQGTSSTSEHPEHPKNPKHAKK